jgi:hypothetical protein
MPKAKQLILTVPDQPGMLGEVAGALGAKKINILGLAAATGQGQGMIWMIVDKTAAAKKLFASRGWDVREEELLRVTLADSPGSLGKLATKLGRAGVNITSIYAGSAGSARKLDAYLTVSDLKAAQKAAR